MTSILWWLKKVGACFVMLTCAVRLVVRAGGAVRDCVWAGVKVVLQPDLEAMSCDFLDLLYGLRWRVLLCISEPIHTTAAQGNDKGDARGFAGVVRQGRKELKGQQCTEGRQTVSTHGCGAARDFCCTVVT